MLLSIIIPTYNSAHFIIATLSMLVAQGLTDCEVIVINDGSTDKTGELCTEFAENHLCIRLITISHSGVSVARNIGLSQAAGNYVYFLDSDDTLMPDTIAFFKETIKQKGTIDIFLFGYKSIYKHKIKKYSYKEYSGMKFNSSESFLRLYLSKKLNCHICSAVFLKKLLLDKQLIFTIEIKIGEDVEFLLNVFSIAKTVYYDARICFVYQIRNDSTMAGYTNYSLAQFNSFMVNFNSVKNISDSNTSIVQEAYFFIANSYVSNLNYYLHSKFKDDFVNTGFYKYKHILYKPIRGNVIRSIVIKILRIVPLNFLFWVFRKI
jgi:glycosyltransferase involved in cell wall biosynthesis